MTRHVPAKSFLIVSAVLLAAAWSQSGAGAVESADTQRPLAVVGADTIRINDLDLEISATLAAAKGRGELPPLNPDAVLKRLIQNRLLEQEGYRVGADQSVQVRNQVRDLIRIRSVKALMDSVSAPPPGTKVENPDSLLGRTNTMRRYAHILVAKEAVARALEDSLTRGVPFSDLAKRHSTDDTAPRGGDLGWSAENAYVEEFESAARVLTLNQIAGPVRTKFGWHLITLVDSKTDTLKSAEMVQALLDGQERERRSAAIRGYVDSLKKKYGVTVNDSLVTTLDYGSKDPAVEKELNSSEAIVASVPNVRLTVKGLTRNIRFQYFHGLGGRADASAIRDRMLDEWLTEALLSHEVRVLRRDQDPGILKQAKLEERRLVREEVLKTIFAFDFKPDSTEVRAHYQEHIKDYTDAPRVKVRSVLLPDEASAQRFREQLEKGAAFKWLESRTPEILDAPAPFPADWASPADLGVKDKTVAEGAVLGPASLPSGWAVGQIVAVEEVRPAPLAECRDKVIQSMRAVRVKAAIEEALSRLQSATTVSVKNGAQAAIASRIEFWRAKTTKGDKS